MSGTKIWSRMIPALGLILSLSLTGCEGFFGKKTDVSFIEIPQYDDATVAYVPILPAMDGFSYPVDVVAGYDELIYVVDAGTEEIISFDQAGNELGRRFVPGVTAIAQDRTLDILAIGTYDTTINSTSYSLAAIYRLDMKNGSYNISNAVLERSIKHPFYFKTSFSASDADVEFTGIATRANGNYYVTRTGPNNNTSQIGGPDDAVIIFRGTDDKFLTPVTVNTGSGFFTDYFRNPIAITSLAQPPQSPFVDERGDFIFASGSNSMTLKVQYIQVSETDNGTDYTVKQLTTGDTTKADRFLYDPNRWGRPADVTYSGDGTNYIFVVDSEKDSLYQFTSTGLEGVKPPSGSTETKNILVSFGGTGNGLKQFKDPMGVAYLHQIVYVADAGNGRVMRYKLTTDLD